jgi:K+/H+ antiporter YhaU regulatory subunit KhtT
MAIISVIAVALISMLINRFATIALMLTGMPHEEARFQARAAMSGVGLTTKQPEEIVGHPVRRRIVFWLMLVGSAGVVTAVASLVLSFKGGSADSRLIKGGILVAVLFLIWAISRVGPVDRALSRGIGWILTKAGYYARDYATLMQLSGDYGVSELQVEEGDWMADRRLRDLRLRDEGVIVMGIHRPGQDYIGAPGPETIVRPRDTLVVYGKTHRIAELDRRAHGASGDEAHVRACAEEHDAHQAAA